MVKKNRQGHYCRICGEFKANEKFSGKGHARHICKSCMSNKSKGLVDKDKITGNTEEYDEDWNESEMEELFGPWYAPFDSDMDSLPPSEPEQKRYKKLSKEEKSALKELWLEIVTRFWNDEHQIPFGESYSRLKRELLEIFEEQGEIELKEDNELKVFLNDSMIVQINKMLICN